MVNQPAWGTDRIKLLAYEIQNRRTKRGRELSEEEVEEKKQEKRDLEARREKAKEGAKARRKLETKITAEADRVIASTETAVRQGTATLERRFDRLEANLASSSSGRDDLLRLLGQPGSSKEIQAEIDARKEDLKRKRREEREEDRQAEKRRKLEQLLEIPLEEGDTLQDGVVLRGDLGRRKMRGLQAVGNFRFASLRCCLVEIGETATLQLDPLNDEQLTALESMAGSYNWPGTIVKLLAVMKDGTVEEAQFLKEKLCGPNRRPIKPLAVRFTSSNFHPPHVFAPKPAEEPVPAHAARAARGTRAAHGARAAHAARGARGVRACGARAARVRGARVREAPARGARGARRGDVRAGGARRGNDREARGRGPGAVRNGLGRQHCPLQRGRCLRRVHARTGTHHHTGQGGLGSLQSLPGPGPAGFAERTVPAFGQALESERHQSFQPDRVSVSATASETPAEEARRRPRKQLRKQPRRRPRRKPRKQPRRRKPRKQPRKRPRRKLGPTRLTRWNEGVWLATSWMARAISS